MKTFLKSFLFLIVIFSCSEESDYYSYDTLVETRGKKEKVTICHQTGNGQITIEVSENAVQAHLDHGDYLGECVDICPNKEDCCFCDFIPSIYKLKNSVITPPVLATVEFIDGTIFTVEFNQENDTWYCTICIPDESGDCNPVTTQLSQEDGTACLDRLRIINNELGGDLCPPNCSL